MQLHKARRAVIFWAIIIICWGIIGLLTSADCCYLFITHRDVFPKAAGAANNEHLEAMIMDLIYLIKMVIFVIIPASSIIMIMAGARIIKYLRIENKHSQLRNEGA
jgi:hypothetical protein